jgi:hypothetical protein
MNAQQAENLRILIRHMETKCARRLDMSHWGACGTPACAAGEATCVPELTARGLEANLYSPVFEGCTAHTALETFFGVQNSLPLFGTCSHNVWGRHDVTPHEWAAEARKVLAEHGYTMDDGFAAFKAKILAPLAEGVPCWPEV